jgi:hypothetical protein
MHNRVRCLHVCARVTSHLYVRMLVCTCVLVEAKQEAAIKGVDAADDKGEFYVGSDSENVRLLAYSCARLRVNVYVCVCVQDDGLPTTCHICKERFTKPIVTKCGHFFCEVRRCVSVLFSASNRLVA